MAHRVGKQHVIMSVSHPTCALVSLPVSTMYHNIYTTSFIPLVPVRLLPVTAFTVSHSSISIVMQLKKNGEWGYVHITYSHLCCRDLMLLSFLSSSKRDVLYKHDMFFFRALFWAVSFAFCAWKSSETNYSAVVTKTTLQ